MLNTNTDGNPARTEMTDMDTEDGGVHGGVKGAASTYVLCPHLTDGAFQFKKRKRETREERINGSRLSRLQTAELTTACTGLYTEENNRNYLTEKREGRQ